MYTEKVYYNVCSFVNINDKKDNSIKKLQIFLFQVYHILEKFFDNLDSVLYELTQDDDINEKLARIMNQPKFIQPKFTDYID